MTGGHPSDDRGPWFEVAGHPVSAPLALVGFCILSMLATTTALAFNHIWAPLLQFSSEAVLHKWELWRLASFVLWNPPSISLALDMLMLWWFGKELEAYFGRGVFLRLCLGIVLAPAIAGVLAGLVAPVQWVGVPGTFALFVAFATMLPNVTLLFGVSAKWTAVVFLSLQLLSCVAEHAWGQLIHSLASAGFAFSYIRFQQGRWEWPRFSFRRPGKTVNAPFKVLEPAHVSTKPKVSEGQFRIVSEEPDALASIDPLLEKIGRSGLASLTDAEREQLQAAREKLLQKEPRRS